MTMSSSATWVLRNKTSINLSQIYIYIHIYCIYISHIYIVFIFFMNETLTKYLRV